jgi:hypothetical protein
MSQSHNFSKQFFADFIAARIRAREIEPRDSPPTRRDRDARPLTAPGTEQNLVRKSNTTLST